MSDAELEARRAQVNELARELEETNRGLIALYTDLERAKEAEARLAAIVQASDDAMFSMSPDGLIESWNPGAEQLLGYRAEAVLGDLTARRRAETELAAALADQEVMADRERIARDLHDLVIQRIFGAGLALHGAVNLAPGHDVERRLEAVIHELDATVSEIRTTIFALHQTPDDAAGGGGRPQQAGSPAPPPPRFPPR